MRRLFLITALGAGTIGGQVAHAQAVTAGGSVQAHVGFGDNPFLSLNSPGSSGVAGGSLTGWLQRASETAQTRLTGVVSLDQNFRYYGRLDNYLASLEHRQTFSARLSGTFAARYQDSINPRNFQDLGGQTTDLLSIGQRSRSYGANGTLQWTPTGRDTFYIGPQYTRTTYPGRLGSDFEAYGLSAGYMRRINEKLRVGVDLTTQRVNSDSFADSTSYQGGVRLMYDFSPIWTFDGNVGLIHQTSRGSSSTTPGFSAELCGKYPRYRVCVEASRQSAASGFGGLRTDNRVRATLDYDLTTLSRLNFGAVYDLSKSSGVSIIPTQKYWEISGGYSRTITDRLSAGFSGRYQSRDYGAFAGVADSTVTGYSVTLDATYKFGRLD